MVCNGLEVLKGQQSAVVAQGGLVALAGVVERDAQAKPFQIRGQLGVLVVITNHARTDDYALNGHIE